MGQMEITKYGYDQRGIKLLHKQKIYAHLHKWDNHTWRYQLKLKPKQMSETRERNIQATVSHTLWCGMKQTVADPCVIAWSPEFES